MSTIIKKISSKTLGIDFSNSDSESVAVYSIIGIANDIEKGLSDNGPWIKFLGQFEATNYQTGEIYSSGSVFLPSPVESLVLGAMGTPDNRNAFGFAFEVGTKPDAKSKTGYIFTVKELVPVESVDALSALRDSVRKIPIAIS